MAFFTVVWKYNDDTDLRDRVRDLHLAYVEEQVANGHIRIALAGPFEDRTGGIFVLEAADDAQLRSVLDGDPFVAHGVVVDSEIYPFQPVLGELTGRSH